MRFSVENPMPGDKIEIMWLYNLLENESARWGEIELAMLTVKNGDQVR